jgi:NADH:ubiquinone oxidoreductase subunit F (NADH-binding)
MSAVLEAPPRPERSTLTRLLPREPLGLAAFARRYGPLPAVTDELLEAVELSGLAGRGGAGFPTARKLRSVRSRRGAVVVGNGTEGEPVSAKDRLLIERNPHLVIDGALTAARLVRTRRIVIAVGRAGGAADVLERALADRRDAGSVSVATVPDRFVAGEESALVHWLNGGEAKPTATPPRPFERGVGGRPTLVQNVETLANLGLIARYGPDWFRTEGTIDEPGTVLATVSGAVGRPGIVEVPLGLPVAEVIAGCGGAREPVQAYLVGGYFGSWVRPSSDLCLSRTSLGAAGGSLGARAVVALGERSCGVVETARVVTYMAEQSAAQCGPCLFGLGALANCLQSIARCTADAAGSYERLEQVERQIARRGACAHPDGVLGLASSATRVFRGEFDRHLAGACSALDHRPVLPTPRPEGGWR